MSACLFFQWRVCLVCLLLVNFNSNQECTKSLGCIEEPGRACRGAWGTILIAFEVKNFTFNSIFPGECVPLFICKDFFFFLLIHECVKTPVRPRSEVARQLACLKSARYRTLPSTQQGTEGRVNWVKPSSDVVMRKQTPWDMVRLQEGLHRITIQSLCVSRLLGVTPPGSAVTISPSPPSSSWWQESCGCCLPSCLVSVLPILEEHTEELWTLFSHLSPFLYPPFFFFDPASATQPCI